MTIRRLKVEAIRRYAEHVQKRLEPLVHGLAAQGYSEAEIEEAIEGLRPMFDEGMEDVLRQITVIGLELRQNDNDGWAELSLPLLRRAFERPQANPAILIKNIAHGLDLMEKSGVHERDGKLFCPGSESHIVKVDWQPNA
jgi:hypothetical protein